MKKQLTDYQRGAIAERKAWLRKIEATYKDVGASLIMHAVYLWGTERPFPRAKR